VLALAVCPPVLGPRARLPGVFRVFSARAAHPIINRIKLVKLPVTGPEEPFHAYF